MRLSHFLLRGAFCLAVFAGALGAQSVAVLTGSQGTSTSIPVFSVNPFAQVTSVNGVQPGAFQLLPKPDGSKYYILTTSSGLTVLDRNLSLPRQILTSLNASPTRAAFSPNGQKLFVIAGNIDYFIDTSSDAILNGGAGISVTGTPLDIAFSIDGQKAYILSNGAFTAYVTPVDLTTLIVGSNVALPIAGTATGIATGPNGLLYVSAPNGLFEINPRTLLITPGLDPTQAATIAVPGANPGKVQFTSAGQTAIALNRTSTGPAIVFNLSTKTASAVSAANLNGATLDQLVIASNNRIFVRTTQSQLLELSLGGGFSSSAVLAGLPSGALVQTVLPSAEAQAKSLFISAIANGANTLYRVDLATNSLVVPQQGFPLANQPGQVLAWTGANPTSGASSIQGYNTNQTIASGAVSLPLVARVLDINGFPVFGATVTYTIQNAGVSLDSTTANTNSDGYAQVYATAGVNPGTATVQASVGGVPGPAYTITIPGTGTGCTQNCNASGVSIVSGNGQVVSEQNTAQQLLLVVVKDANGNPVANQQVTYTIIQGSGTIACTGVGDQFPKIPSGTCTALTSTSTGLVNGIVVTTDINGLAGVKYLGTSIFGQSFAQTTINAAASVGSVNFTMTTVLIALPNGGGQASPPVSQILSPLPESTGYRVIRGTAGQTIPGAIQVQVVAAVGPQAGQPIPGIALNVSGPGDPKTTPSATCAGGTPLTDASGYATCDLILGPVVTSNLAPINVDIGGAIQLPLIDIVVAQGLASKLNIIAGNNQSGRVGQQIVLRAQITDSNGNAVPNVPVSWAVTPQGSGTLGSTSQQSDAQGFVTTTVTLAGGGGNLVVTLTANPSGGTALTGTFNLTVAANVGAVAVSGGNGQTAVTGQPFGQALSVLVTDTNGQPLSNTTVTFAVTGGSAALGATIAVTNAAGVATTTVTAGTGTPGPITITATVGGQSAQFSLTSRAPGPAVDFTSFRNGASGAAGLSPCSIATVSGVGLATGVLGTVQANAFVGPLPYTLSGVNITVNGIPAPLFWVSNTQAGGEAVAFQTPCEVTAGPATVVITVNGGNTTVSNVPVTKYQPGIFQTTINGRPYAVLVHSDGSYVTPDNPARRGEQLKLFATGLGQASPATGTNRAGIGGQASTAIITVGVNNGGVRVLGSEYLPGAIGIYTVTFEVPADTAPGSYQNLGFIVADPADPNTAIYAPGSFLPII